MVFKQDDKNNQKIRSCRKMFSEKVLYWLRFYIYCPKLICHPHLSPIPQTRAMHLLECTIFLGVTMMSCFSFSARTISRIIPHVAVKTANIESAMEFYSLWGYSLEAKFRAGPARAAFLSRGDESMGPRIEVIEVPKHLVTEVRGRDLAENQSLLGLNHVCLDVTSSMGETNDLSSYISSVEKASVARFGKEIKLAVEPFKQIIEKRCYEMAVVKGVDGVLVEVVRYVNDLEGVDSFDYEPW